MATEGTARRLEEAGIQVEHVNKLQEGHPNLLDYLVDGEIQLIMNTPSGKGARTDEGRIRSRPWPMASLASRRFKPPMPRFGRWKPCVTKKSRSKLCKTASPSLLGPNHCDCKKAK